MILTQLRRIHLTHLVALLFFTLLGTNNVHAAEEATYKAIAGNPPAPNLKLTALDGRLVDLESLRGKVVLINFWATWCIPCRREMPSLQRLWLKLDQSSMHILAVDVGEDEATVSNFLSTFDSAPTFPIILDKTSAVLQAWPVKALPTTFLIDPQGRLAYQAIGGLEFDSAASIRVMTELMMAKPSAR